MTYEYRETSGQIGAPPSAERERGCALAASYTVRSGAIPSSQDHKQGSSSTRVGEHRQATYRNGTVEFA